MVEGQGLSLAERARQGLSLSDELVIDAHAHIGVIKDYAIPQADAASLVRGMDRYGVDRACIFGFAGVCSDYVYGNDEVISAVSAFPDRFIGYATLNANYPEDLIAELERCFELGLRGIKLITMYQGHPEETERFEPVYAWAEKRRTIILSHQWGPPEFLASLAGRYPSVCFHIGHLNPAYAHVARQYENIFTTTTFVPSPVAIVQAVEAFGVENILFGSDVPDLNVSLNIGPLLSAEISEVDKRAILGGNMARVLAEYIV